MEELNYCVCVSEGWPSRNWSSKWLWIRSRHVYIMIYIYIYMYIYIYIWIIYKYTCIYRYEQVSMPVYSTLCVCLNLHVKHNAQWLKELLTTSSFARSQRHLTQAQTDRKGQGVAEVWTKVKVCWNFTRLKFSMSVMTSDFLERFTQWCLGGASCCYNSPSWASDHDQIPSTNPLLLMEEILHHLGCKIPCK